MRAEAPLRSFGRLRARALKPRQAALMDTLLPQLSVASEGPVDPAALFPGVADVAFEIGFGAGEHLVSQARAHPEMGFIGAEPFQNGVGACLSRIAETGLANIRLHEGDARELMARLPEASLARLVILFPDPWPKTRHWKRRLIQAETVAEFARVLRPGGELRFGTDWRAYAAWTLELFLKEPRFDWTAERAADWEASWPGYAPTRYEEKRLGDTAPIYLRFRRR